MPVFPVTYLNKDRFDVHVRENPTGHWEKPEERWAYHEKALEAIKQVNLQSPKEVLEMGTMGMSLVTGSDTLDVDDRDWPLKVPVRPTYTHDARETPWPIPDKRYQLLIALRVFQHLYPKQREAFLEAKRVASSVLILVPETYPETIFKGLEARGISEAQFTEWNAGAKPTAVTRLPSWLGTMFYWAPKV